MSRARAGSNEVADSTSQTGPDAWLGDVRVGAATGDDGTRIHYEVVGEGNHTLLLANGLGGRFYSWRPLIEALRARYRIVTWDYRGLFHSDSPPSHRQLSVPNHAADALSVLRAEGVERAVLCGWSMGVQVALEAAASFPKTIAGLVLMNGTYGHVLRTGLQPLFSVPWLPKRLHAFVELLRQHPHLTTLVADVARMSRVPVTATFVVTAGRRALELQPMLQRYMDDVLGPSFPNYLRLFQELDAHSVYHLLPEIPAPALVISGKLDAMTPAFQSRHIARRLPHAEHLALCRASHYALLERPEVVLPAIERFLESRPVW